MLSRMVMIGAMLKDVLSTFVAADVLVLGT